MALAQALIDEADLDAQHLRDQLTAAQVAELALDGRYLQAVDQPAVRPYESLTGAQDPAASRPPHRARGLADYAVTYRQAASRVVTALDEYAAGAGKGWRLRQHVRSEGDIWARVLHEAGPDTGSAEPFRVISAGPDASSLLDGLLAWWVMDEATGVRYDRHRAHHLAAVNSPGDAPGRGGGRAGRIVRPSQQSLAHADAATLRAPLALATWFWLDEALANNAYNVVAKWEAGTRQEYSLRVAAGTVSMRLGDGAGGTTAALAIDPAPDVGRWALAQVWHEAGALYLALDGGAPVSVASPAPVAGTAPFLIGAEQGPTDHFYGRVQDVSLWSRALTAGERAALWAGGVGISYPGVR